MGICGSLNLHIFFVIFLENHHQLINSGHLMSSNGERGVVNGSSTVMMLLNVKCIVLNYKNERMSLLV